MMSYLHWIQSTRAAKGTETLMTVEVVEAVFVVNQEIQLSQTKNMMLIVVVKST